MLACFVLRGGSRAAATSKMEHFAIIVNGFTKRSILDVAAALDPPLTKFRYFNFEPFKSLLWSLEFMIHNKSGA